MKRPEEFTRGQLTDAFLFEPDPPSPTVEHLEEVRQLLLAQTTPSALPSEGAHESAPDRPRMALGSGEDRSTTVRASTAHSRPAWGWGRKRAGRDAGDQLGDDRLGVGQVQQSPSKRGWRYLGPWLAVALCLAAAGVFWWPQPESPVTHFRRVMAVAGTHAWVHGQTTVTAPHGDWSFETWFSPSERLAALRSESDLHHTDYKLGLQTTYHLATQSLQQTSANPHGEHFGRAFMIALLKDGDLQAAMPFHSVSEVNKLSVGDGQQALIQYQFQVSWRSNPNVGWLTTVLVQANNQRIVSWEERHTNGTIVLTRFEYPHTGPRDIYELGAPRDATPDASPDGQPAADRTELH